MLRLVLNTTLFTARNLRRTPRPHHPLPSSETQTPSSPNTLASTYLRTKQQYEALDHPDHAASQDNQNYQHTMALIEQMLKDTPQENQPVGPPKAKLTIADKLAKMGVPEAQIKQYSSQPVPSTASRNHSSTTKTTPPHQEAPQPSPWMDFKGRKQGHSELEEWDDQEIDPLQLKKAQQDILMHEIVSKSKLKEVKHLRTADREESLDTQQQRLLLRQQKLLAALRDKQDPSQHSYPVTHEELISMRYSPEIIAKAQTYKNQQLAYFKELILDEEQEMPQSKDLLHQRGSRQPGSSIPATKELQPTPAHQILRQQKQEQRLARLKGHPKREEQGLVKFEDLKFYQEKALQQLRDKDVTTQEDQRILKNFERDLLSGNKQSDVFLDDVAFRRDAKLQRNIALADTSFGRQQKALKNLQSRLQKLGLDYDSQQLVQLSKSALFTEKKRLEEEQEYQRYLHRKEKRKNMRKQLRKMHEAELRDDLNYDQVSPKTMSIKQIKQSNDLNMLEEAEKMEESNQQKQTVLKGKTAEERASEIHQIKTFKNMQGMLTMYFAQGLFNHGHNQLEQVQVLQVLPNRTNTLLHVFWDIEPKHLAALGILPGTNHYASRLQELKKEFQQRLTRQATYISGKMTQFMRLRYGPEIRFHYDLKTEDAQEAVQELGKYLKEIAMVEVEEYTKKGLIKSQQQQIEYFQKMLQIAKEKLGNYNSRKQLISKTYRKEEKRRINVIESQLKKEEKKAVSKVSKKHKRVNPIFEEEEEEKAEEAKKGKQWRRPSDKLWDQLQLL